MTIEKQKKDITQAAWLAGLRDEKRGGYWLVLDAAGQVLSVSTDPSRLPLMSGEQLAHIDALPDNYDLAWGWVYDEQLRGIKKQN